MTSMFRNGLYLRPWVLRVAVGLLGVAAVGTLITEGPGIRRYLKTEKM